MRRHRITGLAVTALSLFAFHGQLWAEEGPICLDCHEPAEDWQGLSQDKILATAKDSTITRHVDNAEYSDEQLRAMIAELLQQ